MLHSGIDLHKRTVVISTVDPSGHAVRDAELPTTRARIQSYFAALPGPHRAVVESTSNWYWLSDLLLGSGIDLRLGHSKYIKAISYAKVKTDAADAATLAQLLRSDLIPEAHMISPEWREARDLLRARLQVVGAQVRCKNTVEGLLAQYNVSGWESLLEDRLQPCRGPSDPILPGDQDVLSAAREEEATRRRTHARGEGASTNSLLHAQEVGGLQRHLQRETAEPYEAAEVAEVATAGEPVRLTGAALQSSCSYHSEASTSAAFDWDPKP